MRRFFSMRRLARTESLAESTKIELPRCEKVCSMKKVFSVKTNVERELLSHSDNDPSVVVCQYSS